MALTDDLAKQVKEQLLKQLDKVPPESRAEIEKQIKTMTNEQLEEFIKKNQESQGETSECIFCTIAKGKTPSIKIDENEDSVAVLDINPISVGHTLIIPKKHEGEPTEKTQELAFKVGGQILDKLKPKDITTRVAKMMGHTILNVIPIYDDTDLEKRIQTTEPELLSTAEKILGKKLASEKPKPTKIEKVEEKIPKPKKPSEPVCTFCSIANKEAQSFIIDENKENTAILEINPLSRGHTLVIPKSHNTTTHLPTSTFTLAKKIANKIKTKYKPTDVKINPTSINNHALIELIPIYDNKKELKERQKASEQELKAIQKDLTPKTTTQKATSKKTIKKSETKKRKGTFILPKRNHPGLPHMGPRIP